METNNSFDQEIPKYSDYAGFWLRLVAYLLDAVILNLASLFVLKPILFLFGINFLNLNMESFNDFMRMAEEDPAAIQQMSQSEIIEMLTGATLSEYFIVAFSSLIMHWLYFSIMESSSKQGTIGKMALQLKVTDINGNRISFLRATGRHFGKIISGITLCIGYIMAAFTDRKQALHD